MKPSLRQEIEFERGLTCERVDYTCECEEPAEQCLVNKIDLTGDVDSRIAQLRTLYKDYPRRPTHPRWSAPKCVKCPAVICEKRATWVIMQAWRPDAGIAICERHIEDVRRCIGEGHDWESFRMINPA